MPVLPTPTASEPSTRTSTHTPEMNPSPSAPSPSSQSQPSKHQRVLACVRCQQRKIKCDRRFPCANCQASSGQCVPATLIHRSQRKRRFPERELLERLRKYEDLLRQNNIKFKPLHNNPAGEKESPYTHGGDESDGQPETSSPSTTVQSDRVYEAKYALAKYPCRDDIINSFRNYWRALTSGFRDSDNGSESSEDVVHDLMSKKGWDQLFGENDHFLFGSPNTNVDLSTLHPEPVQIFRLWQVYLDNVNPLLKVTHIPSLQGRIIEAASKITDISPTLEALMFSIYCISILSFNADDCQAIFGASKEDLLTRFQFGCQQALQNCHFLRSKDRDCLTALYLYLVTVRFSIVPRSLSAVLGIAIRIAERMGIHSESALAQCTPLEAELRRRLWWSLVLFDTRMSEMAEHKIATLSPIWDCKIPLNVNDSDLRPEMKELPAAVLEKPTDALFAVVRCELAEFLRHSRFHLDFTNPALKPLSKTIQQDSMSEVAELTSLEKMIEDKYLKFCDLENPLHFMTIWWTRSYLARCRLWEHHSRHSGSAHQTDTDRDAAICYALRLLECDTKFMTSPHTKGFLWLVHLYFPFPAYLQIVQDLRRRPWSERAEQAWEAMSDNYDAQFSQYHRFEGHFFTAFSQIVLQAWEAREAAFNQMGDPLIPPRIVSAIRHRVAQTEQNRRIADTQQPNSVMDMNIDNFPMSTLVGSGSNDLLYNMGGQGGGYGVMGLGPGAYPNIPGAAQLDDDMNNTNWATMDWDLGGTYTGIWGAGV